MVLKVKLTGNLQVSSDVNPHTSKFKAHNFTHIALLPSNLEIKTKPS